MLGRQWYETKKKLFLGRLKKWLLKSEKQTDENVLMICNYEPNFNENHLPISGGKC